MGDIQMVKVDEDTAEFALYSIKNGVQLSHYLSRIRPPAPAGGHIPELDPDIEVIKLSVKIDHVHKVIVVPPRIAVAEVVKYIKSQSEKKLKAKFPFLHKTYTSKEGIWSRGYWLNEKEILAYVAYQEKKDKGQLQLTL